jgi:hypothetical protein
MACVFFHLVFKEHGSSQAGERSLLRWFWSFTGMSGTVAARTGADLVLDVASRLVFAWLYHLLNVRQIESSGAARNWPPHPPSSYVLSISCITSFTDLPAANPRSICFSRRCFCSCSNSRAVSAQQKPEAVSATMLAPAKLMPAP